MQIQEGNILRSSFWPEKVRVVSVKPIGESQVRGEAVGLHTKSFILTLNMIFKHRWTFLSQNRCFFICSDKKSGKNPRLQNLKAKAERPTS